MTDPQPITVYNGIERRAGEWHTPEDCHKLLSVQAAMDAVNERLDDGSARMARIEACLKTNNDAAAVHRERFEKTLQENTEATAEILEIITTAKGFFKGCAAIGNAVKWIVGLATACIAFWFAIKNGGK